MSATIDFVPVRTDAQLATVVALAHDIWYEYYVPLIGRAQVDYMVAKFQSAAAMQAQIHEGYEYFLVRQEGLDTGYMALHGQLPEGRMFISKLYLHRNGRGAGTGRRCMEFIEQLARERRLGMLWLTVNKGNPAVKAYERLGFKIAEAIVMDIGNGFVMDDFRMEKSLI